MDRVKEVQRNLITANHILHHHSNLDAYGHISARHPNNADIYLLSASIAPAMISNATDLIEYRVSDSTPLDPNATRGYIERYIHGEIYKRFPGVNSVVHSHAAEVLPFAITGVSLLPVYHMAGFLGTETPVWDIAKHYNETQPQDLLVRSTDLGAALANAFEQPKPRTGASGSPIPDHSVVLMRRHGFTTYGVDLKEAVYRALFTQSNAKIQTASILLRNSFNTIFQRPLDGIEDTLEPLTAQMAKDCTTAISGTVDRPWGLWVREVEKNSLYINNV